MNIIDKATLRQIISKSSASPVASSMGTAGACLSTGICRKPAVKQRKKEPKERTEPARKSSRLQGAAAADESNELGFCVTNDECPRCGKASSACHMDCWHSLM